MASQLTIGFHIGGIAPYAVACVEGLEALSRHDKIAEVEPISGNNQLGLSILCRGI